VLENLGFLLYAVTGAVVILAMSVARRKADKYTDFCIATGLLVFVVLLAIPQKLTVVLHPHTVDWLLYRADLALGLDPLPVARLVYATPWLERALVVSYDALPLAVAIAWAVERPRAMFPAMVVSSGLAFACYNLLPAVGPAHAFAGFPFAAPHLAGVDAGLPRNCIPSMHLGWALLIAWNVRGRALRTCAWLFAGLTALATVGLGEHYFVDLLAAVPFCFAVQLATSRQLLPRATARTAFPSAASTTTL
jgi:PAP2 superfamily